MNEPKLNIEEIQEQDLINIKIQGYSNNMIISFPENQGYTLTNLPDESDLPF